MKKNKKIFTEPFDRYKKPPKQNLFLTPLIWLCCWFLTRRGRLKIRRIRMKGLKPPFFVLGTHHAFMDFYVTPLTLFPHRANYVSELEGFEAFGEWIYRQVGCLGTRKFVNDLALPRNIKRIMDRKGILVLYPEARYANVGTSSDLSDSVGKLAKMLKVPIVTVHMKGNYLQSPIWNLKHRKGVPLEADIEQLYTREELAQATLPEISKKIQNALSYDEYAWQFERKIKISEEFRAEGLELVLYQCPHCCTEFQMSAKGAILCCRACQSQWYMSEYGRLEFLPASASSKLSSSEVALDSVPPKMTSDSSSFDSYEVRPEWHIPDWYEWQREQVIQSIDRGEYSLQTCVHIESLPNAKNFIDLGDGDLLHDQNGFALTFIEYGDKEKQTLVLPPISMYSIHTEYDYRGKGQCVTLSTLDNTYFLYPRGEGFNATKIQFATEYLFVQAKRKKEHRHVL